jgi:hypothetical protein
VAEGDDRGSDEEGKISEIAILPGLVQHRHQSVEKQSRFQRLAPARAGGVKSKKPCSKQSFILPTVDHPFAADNPFFSFVRHTASSNASARSLSYILRSDSVASQSKRTPLD